MGFACLIKKIELFVKETTNKAIVKIQNLNQSRFENHIPTKGFSLLSKGTFITTSKTYACN